MLSVACVSVTVSSADDPRVIIPARNLRASGTDVSWHCSLNPCSLTVNVWLLSFRYDAISRRRMRAAFVNALQSCDLQSCDELQHRDVVTRCCIAEAGISITSRLNHISSSRTGNRSILYPSSLFDLRRCRLQSAPFVDMFSRIYPSGESMFFRWSCLHQSLPTPLQWLCCEYLDGMSLFLQYQS